MSRILRARGLRGPRVSGQPLLWTPANLPSLAFWYRSDLGVTASGGAVSAWADQSGNGRHLVQATPANRPTLVSSVAGMRGRPGISFDGSDILATASTFSLPRTVSVFVVCGAVTSRGMLVEHGSGDGFYVYAAGAAAAAVFGPSGLGYHRAFQSPVSTWTPANSHCAMLYDGTNPPILRGSDGLITPTSTDGVAQSGNRDKALFVGARSGGSLWHTGEVLEIFGCAEYLGSTHVAQAETYLSARYGV